MERGLGLKLAPKFKSALEKLLLERKVDLIHNHGVWLPANHSASVVARKYKKPCIITPHGMLTIWCYNFKPLKKRIAWQLYLKKDVMDAAIVHMTSQGEVEEFKKLGFKGRLAVIPNGIHLPVIDQMIPKLKDGKTALFVSRIHPKKGLLNLVEAWSRIRPKGWRMRLVGPDEGGHRKEVERALIEKGLADDFIFEGPIFGERLWEIYRTSDVFILPTLSENFGNVVPEALACGLPVVCTYGAPWEELVTRKCGWWIPIGVEALTKTLREVFETTASERMEMGIRGRKLVEEKYTWESVGKKMKLLYEWVLGGGAAPEFVLRK